MLRLGSVACALLLVAAPARADRMAPVAQPAERALRVPVVVVGTVTAVEKEPVEATPHPGAEKKVPYKVAVVKVGTNLAGAESLTHLKVGFIPAGAGGRRGPENPDLKEGQEWLFFLTKHHGGAFHAIPYMTPPVDSKSPNFKNDVGAVKKVLAVVADPAKALKSEKAADRFDAAVALVLKYRTTPEGASEVKPEEVPAGESKLVLKSLAEGEWKPDPAGGRLNGVSAFFALGLTEADGWAPPQVKPGEDYAAVNRAAFVKWLAGPGQDYRIKKLVQKK